MYLLLSDFKKQWRRGMGWGGQTPAEAALWEAFRARTLTDTTQKPRGPEREQAWTTSSWPCWGARVLGNQVGGRWFVSETAELLFWFWRSFRLQTVFPSADRRFNQPPKGGWRNQSLRSFSLWRLSKTLSLINWIMTLWEEVQTGWLWWGSFLPPVRVDQWLTLFFFFL